MTVPKCIIDMMELNKNNLKNNLRTIETKIVPKLKNNDPWPKVNWFL